MRRGREVRLPHRVARLGNVHATDGDAVVPGLLVRQLVEHRASELKVPRGRERVEVAHTELSLVLHATTAEGDRDALPHCRVQSRLELDEAEARSALYGEEDVARLEHLPY